MPNPKVMAEPNIIKLILSKYGLISPHIIVLCQSSQFYEVMWGGFKSNTKICWIMWVKYLHVLEYSNNANNKNTVSNYSHYLHDFMQVITSKICIIRNICMIQIFEYLESNNYAMQAMQGGYAMLCKYIRVYASIQISWIFFLIFNHA